jgi:integrase
MRYKLTAKFIDGLQPPAKGNFIRWDAETKSLGIRITANNNRSFVFGYRTNGAEHRDTIGEWGTWTIPAAREEAKRRQRIVDAGGDPIADRAKERSAPTVSDLADRFIAEVLPRKRPATANGYKRQIEGEVLPAIGKLKVAAVTFDDIDRLHRKVSAHAPIHANRVHALCSSMFAMAIKWRMRSDNPCRSIERNRENKRQRYLSDDEMERLGKVLARYPDREVAAGVTLLFLTGARKGELANMTWDQIDLVKATWSKPASMTKQKRDHTIPLSAAAVELLKRLPKQSEYVFPRWHRSLSTVRDHWHRLVKEAKITGFRMHDLRHSYASILVSSGHSLPVIGALLGHAAPSTTARYSHLFDDVTRAATEKVGMLITGK